MRFFFVSQAFCPWACSTTWLVFLISHNIAGVIPEISLAVEAVLSIVIYHNAMGFMFHFMTKRNHQPPSIAQLSISLSPVMMLVTVRQSARVLYPSLPRGSSTKIHSSSIRSLPWPRLRDALPSFFLLDLIWWTTVRPPICHFQPPHAVNPQLATHAGQDYWLSNQKPGHTILSWYWLSFDSVYCQ